MIARLCGLAALIAAAVILLSSTVLHETRAAVESVAMQEPAALLPAMSGTVAALLLLVLLQMQREIRRRKRAERSLRDLNAELDRRVSERTAELERRRSFTEAVLDNMRDAVMVVGLERQIVYANPACAALLAAASPDELMRHAPIDLVAVPQREEVRDTVHRRLSEGESIPLIERRVLRLDGREIDVESTIAPFLQGEQSHAAVMMRDITARKAMEAQIAQRTREAESWGRFIVAVQATMRDALMVIRGETIAHANGAFASLVGAARARDVVGRSPYEFIPEAQAAAVAGLASAILEGHAVPTIEGALRRLDGSSVEVETTVGQFFDRGEMVVVLIIRDISDRKLTEQRLHHGQKMEALGQLTGGIAHDFNNLLAVTICNLDLALEITGDNPELRSLLNSAVAGAMRGSHLTQRLLAFSRKTVLEPAVIDLNAQVEGLREMLSRTLGSSVTVMTALSDPLWRTLIDPSQLEDAIVNLAINARDGMPGGGTLTIETANVRLDEEAAAVRENAKEGDYVMVAVRDTGTGIDPDILDKVLDPFFTTKAVGQGSGLGLSMVYGFVRQSDGHLRILSEPGRGTVVQLFLPRTERAPAAAIAAEPAQQEAAQGERILLVDDNPELLAAARRQLSALGYRVRTAANGVTALRLIDDGEPVDLLLSDIVMPDGINGFQLVAEARRRRPDLKVLLMSGYSNQSPGERDPAIRVLTKPYRRQELAEAVRETLQGAAPSMAAE